MNLRQGSIRKNASAFGITMVPDDSVVLLKWMTDMRVLEFYEGRDSVFISDRVSSTVPTHAGAPT